MVVMIGIPVASADIRKELDPMLPVDTEMTLPAANTTVTGPAAAEKAEGSKPADVKKKGTISKKKGSKNSSESKRTSGTRNSKKTTSKKKTSKH